MDNTKWTELLSKAVSEPGLILKAYSAFHGYSLGNRIAAMMQCAIRGIEPGPINTYPGWQSLNRQVKKGEKAITLCMPLTRKVTDESTGESARVATNFVWKNRWFVLSQTEGEPLEPITSPAWNKELALSALGITEQPFTLTDGNVQGYAEGRTVVISPLAAMPHKTLFHEIAHIELGHTAESNFTDSDSTPRSLREAEAEGVAMLLCESLELPGVEYSRGYIQNWLKGDTIHEKSAQKIFGAADRILRAGQEVEA
ncbi:MAG TPA: ArdC-like ssDNA-binding domain-containing protein [Blastocatellia bacterium]|nr:ArdC-like ssDNA-binding domain-containing protein [Blastocatellia bacterium]